MSSRKDLCPFYMQIRYGNAFCADYTQASVVKD